MRGVLLGHKQSGQAAGELALFGAVLIFLVGGIVRNGLLQGQQQNLQLKAMRMALLNSYKGAQPKVNSASGEKRVHTGHNNASLLYIEDRLSPEINRYGNNERTIIFASGSGMMTNLLYYPLDTNGANPEYTDKGNWPVMDLYINGIHIPLYMSAIVTKSFGPPSGFNSEYTTLPAELNGKVHYKGWDFTCKIATSWSGVDKTMFSNADPSGGNDVMNSLIAQAILVDVDVSHVKLSPLLKTPVTRPVEMADPAYDPVWNALNQSFGTVYKGCPLFYSTTMKADDYGALSEDEAYDLNRNDDFTDDPAAASSPGKPARKDILWHWKAQDATTDLGIDTDNQSNTAFDVDGDGQDETIYHVDYDENGIVVSAIVMDGQDGDYDASKEKIFGREPGLQRESSLITQSKDGTNFIVKEGKLYNPESGQYVRSVGFRDQAELVQRMYQLTNNTGHFCDKSDPPVSTASSSTWWNGQPNPVEACGTSGCPSTGCPATGGVTASTCFNSDRITKTCFDTDTYMLYIRSRILDRTGHAWLSDTKGKLP